MHPEFNFAANIKRSLFAVWQEYQGLGLLGGMGHASDLLHQLFLLTLSIILPTSILRYVWTFLMLFTGSVGVYFLTMRIMRGVTRLEGPRAIALVGGLFYLLNLSSMQMFYTPFEAFSAFFGFLPWLLLTTINYFINPNRKSLLFLILVLILSTPAWYIPTLFVVYLLTISIISLTLLFWQKKTEIIKRTIKVFILVFLINAFWLLPFAYFTFTNSSVAVGAKINQMATEEVFLKNKEFGGINDVMLLKGFWFNNVEPDLLGNYSYMLAPWRQHFDNPLINIIGFLFFAVILVGVVGAVRGKNKISLAFAALFLFAFTMLATETPPFSWINSIFRQIPLFDQAFRFPFTKFSTLASLTYAIFFALGISRLFHHLPSIFKKPPSIVYLLPSLLLVIFTFPAFTGHLFYQKERLAIPQEYFALFNFFKNQDQNTRIANFPQHTFWGWNFYNFNYSGSGFLWYGIKQPILDRAFDVWSRTNENYYFELSDALYAKDPFKFEQILNKYQISWLLVDKNVVNPPSPKALFFSELEELADKIPNITKTQTFGNIDIYKVTLKDNPQNFVFVTNELPTVNGYQWNNNDQAYLDNGDYLSSITNYQLPITNYYPFRSLFSNKSQKDIEFAIKENADSIELIAELPQLKQATLRIPSFSQKETVLPITITDKKTAVIKTPAVFLNNQKLWGEEFETPLYSVIAIIDKNTGTSQTKVLPKDLFNSLPLLQETTISLSSQEGDVLRVEIPKIEDNYVSFKPTITNTKLVNCDNFRRGTINSVINDKEQLELSSKNATACVSFYSPTLPHDQGYAIFVDSKNEKGRGLHFWIENNTTSFSPIDTYLPTERKLLINTFILPPQDPQGIGYTLHLENVSIGNEETKNNLGKISVYPIPYNFLTSLVLTSNNQLPTTNYQQPITVSHPNESLYVVQLPITNYQLPTTLVLSQSFNAGWKMYRIKNYELGIMNGLNLVFPFFFGEEIKEHVLVNNWANGWVIDKLEVRSEKLEVIIVYLPQYLEYLGFLIILVVLSVISFSWIFVSLGSRKGVQMPAQHLYSR